MHIRLIRRYSEPVAMKKVKYIDHPFLQKQINGIAQAFCQRDHMQLAAFFKRGIELKMKVAGENDKRNNKGQGQGDKQPFFQPAEIGSRIRLRSIRMRRLTLIFVFSRMRRHPCSFLKKNVNTENQSMQWASYEQNTVATASFSVVGSPLFSTNASTH